MCENISKDSNLVISLDDTRFSLDPEEYSFQWTPKAQGLIERMLRRLHKIWERHFPDEGEIEIYSGWYKTE